MAKQTLDTTFRARLTPAQRRMLTDLATWAGFRSDAEAFRQILRAAWERWQREHPEARREVEQRTQQEG